MSATLSQNMGLFFYGRMVTLNYLGKKEPLEFHVFVFLACFLVRLCIHQNDSGIVTGGFQNPVVEFQGCCDSAEYMAGIDGRNQQVHSFILIGLFPEDIGSDFMHFHIQHRKPRFVFLLHFCFYPYNLTIKNKKKLYNSFNYIIK